MRQSIKILLLITILLTESIFGVNAQVAANGNVNYYLPNTALTITIDADLQTFTAGPYAKYAEQYFDYPADIQNSSKCAIKSISIESSTVADLSKPYSLLLSTKNNNIETLMFLDKQGMICFTNIAVDSEKVNKIEAVDSDNPFVGKGLDINTIAKTFTTYKQVETEEGVLEVPETYSEDVELTIDLKAKELANTIHTLKQSRVDLITGNTDAEYSGEAMRAVIDELEESTEDFFTMFYGYKKNYTQREKFDIVPNGSDNSIVICRLSDTKGILPSDSKEGRPIVLTISSDSTKDTTNTSESAAKSGSGTFIRYRVPAYVNVVISDGNTILFKRKVQILQYGVENIIPM